MFYFIQIQTGLHSLAFIVELVVFHVKNMTRSVIQKSYLKLGKTEEKYWNMDYMFMLFQHVDCHVAGTKENLLRLFGAPITAITFTRANYG